MKLWTRIWDRSFRLIPDALLTRLASDTVVAPCYHLVTDESPLHVRHLYRWRTTKAFQEDLDYILRRFTLLPLDRLYESLRQHKPLPKNSAFLSFDDGFREMSDVVAPICLAKGAPATFFLTTAFLDNRELGFRQKASILIERSSQTGAERSKTALAPWAADQGISPDRLSELSRFFLSINYEQRSLLDQAAQLLQVDFEDYLRKEKPYLDSEQVKRLIADGFSIGGHSVDHPLYSQLPEAQQISQTRECMMELATRFDMRTKAFAFPFVSDGIGETYYAEVFAKRDVDVVFCIGQMPLEHNQFAVSRFGVESREPRPLGDLVRDQIGGQMKGRALELLKRKALRDRNEKMERR